MPASSARIGFITRQFRIAEAGPDATVDARYGDRARDTDEPFETFFERVEDAQTMADERMMLLSADRRLFSVTITGRDDIDSLIGGDVIPTAALVDEKRQFDDDALIVGARFDDATNRTVLDIWG